ncbi:MAG: DUF4231 domain-containing protein [Blastocatellia bacterium]
MTPDEFMTERVDDQIEWYGKKSGASQRAYKRLRLCEIAGAASIPFLTAYVEIQSVKFLVGALGVMIAVISGVLTLYKHQENWLRYRGTCEELKSERMLFLTQTAPYDTADAFPLFVHKVEALLAGETKGWIQYITAKDKPDEKV